MHICLASGQITTLPTPQKNKHHVSQAFPRNDSISLPQYNSSSGLATVIRRVSPVITPLLSPHVDRIELSYLYLLYRPMIPLLPEVISERKRSDERIVVHGSQNYNPQTISSNTRKTKNSHVSSKQNHACSFSPTTRCSASPKHSMVFLNWLLEKEGEVKDEERDYVPVGTVARPQAIYLQPKVAHKTLILGSEMDGLKQLQCINGDGDTPDIETNEPLPE